MLPMVIPASPFFFTWSWQSLTSVININKKQHIDPFHRVRLRVKN